MTRPRGRFGLLGPPVLLAILLAVGFWQLNREPAPSADGLPAAQFGGSVSALAVRGERAWLGTGNRLQGVDISKPEVPLPLGQSEALPEAIRSVAIAGDFVYAAAGLSGLAIFDASDPLQPERIATIKTPWATNGLALDGDLAFLAEGVHGLRIFDISRPDAARQIGRIDTPGDALAVALDRRDDLTDGPGLLAYVADWGSGVRIIDVDDPTQPRELAWIDTSGVAAGVSAAGDRLVIADREEGLVVVDVKDPSHPRLRATLALPGTPERVALSGDRAFVAAQDGGAIEIDLLDPDRPRQIGALESATVVMDVTATERGVYFADVGTLVAPAVDSRADLWARMHVWGVEGAPKVAAGLAGMHLVARADAGMREIGMYFSPSLIEGGDLLQEAAIMYLADGLAGVLVVDVADPAAPTLIGSLDLPGATHDLKIMGDRAIVAAGDAGVVFLDLTDPRDPRAIATVDTPGEALGIALYDGLIYVADGPGGLRVIDPGRVNEIGFFDTPGNSWDVTVEDGYAYVSDRPGGLRIYDLSLPYKPKEVAVIFEHQIDVLDVAIQGDRAWVAGGLAGVLLLDISDPAAPKRLSELVLEDRAIGILTAGDRLYVAAGTEGLRELKIGGLGEARADGAGPVGSESDEVGGDPSDSEAAPSTADKLHELRGWSMPGSAERMLRFGNRIFVAAEMGGLQIVPIGP
jgi:hypothetical protein